MILNHLTGLDLSLGKSVIALLAVTALASFDIFQRTHHRPTHILFASVLGSLLSVGLIQLVRALFEPTMLGNSYALALGILLVILCWKTAFGPWETQTKSVILGTFLFWIAFHVLSQEEPAQRKMHLIAILCALVPAGIWCFLFLKYHAQRLGNVCLMFLAGCLSTVPILFYDALVRKGVELHFFLFRITPESFTRTSQSFVAEQLSLTGGLKAVLVTSVISFLFVGFVEEVSKYWVLIKSGKRIFSSIDDVLQLSIIVAIGFSFAENVINPVYFTGFVRDYLFHSASPDVLGFLSNILGRSVLTSMVHIVSTGVMGYFIGVALYASPYLQEEREKGHAHRILRQIHLLLRLPTTAVFRVQMFSTGILAAIVLHTGFNFLVTLPDLLPGNPHSVGEALDMAAGSPLHLIPLLLLPALLYVVGGFWLLTFLFLRKESMEERGHLQTSITLVPASQHVVIEQED